MTYSIVARDSDTGELGVAVQSHYFSVGSVVTWAEPGIGVVATQSFAEPAYGPRGLALMRLGVEPVTAMAALTSADTDEARRQVAFLDASGRVAVHTGALCIEAAGHATAEGVSVQANMMRGPGVWPAMLEAFEASKGPLADRLMAALDAAEAAGGDIRGRQSAAMLIVSGTSSSQPWRERRVDLRVDDSPDPLGELRRLIGVHRGYEHIESAEAHEITGDFEAALTEFEHARALLAGNDEAAFWSAILMADAGHVEEGKAILADITTREPGWSDLLRRLPAVDLLRNGQATVTALLGS